MRLLCVGAPRGEKLSSCPGKGALPKECQVRSYCQRRGDKGDQDILRRVGCEGAAGWQPSLVPALRGCCGSVPLGRSVRSGQVCCLKLRSEASLGNASLTPSLPAGSLRWGGRAVHSAWGAPTPSWLVSVLIWDDGAWVAGLAQRAL